MEGACAVLAVLLQHWAALGFTDVRVGELYVDVSLGRPVNRETLRTHMRDVLTFEHAYNVQLQVRRHPDYWQHTQILYHYVEADGQTIRGTFTIVYNAPIDEEQDAEEEEEEENEERDEYAGVAQLFGDAEYPQEEDGEENGGLVVGGFL